MGERERRGTFHHPDVLNLMLFAYARHYAIKQYASLYPRAGGGERFKSLPMPAQVNYTRKVMRTEVERKVRQAIFRR